MNIILFRHRHNRRTLEANDPRAVHARSILHMGPGDRFDAGVLNGPRGKAEIIADDRETGMELRFRFRGAYLSTYPRASR